MAYSEVFLAVHFESDTWIIHDSKLLNLEVENYTSNVIHILENHYPRQPVDPDASMERNTWMDQNKAAMAQLVSTIDIDHLKFKTLDTDGILDDQKPLILFNLNGVLYTFDQRAECAGRVESCALEGCMNLILDAPFFKCVSLDAQCSQFLYSVTRECTHTSCFHSVRVPEKKHITRVVKTHRSLDATSKTIHKQSHAREHGIGVQSILSAVFAVKE